MVHLYNNEEIRLCEIIQKFKKVYFFKKSVVCLTYEKIFPLKDVGGTIRLLAVNCGIVG
jgi:hypothetical protein